MWGVYIHYNLKCKAIAVLFFIPYCRPIWGHCRMQVYINNKHSSGGIVRRNMDRFGSIWIGLVLLYFRGKASELFTMLLSGVVWPLIVSWGECNSCLHFKRAEITTWYLKQIAVADVVLKMHCWLLLPILEERGYFPVPNLNVWYHIPLIWKLANNFRTERFYTYVL